MIWTWQPCELEPGLTFLMREWLVPPPDYYTRCFLDDDGVPTCVEEALYTPPQLRREGPVATASWWDHDDTPARGEMLWLDVQAVDAADNESRMECAP